MTARRLARGSFLAFAAAILGFSAVVVITARDGDPSLYPGSGADIVPILLVNHGYHTGLVLPRATVAEVAGRLGLPALIAVTTRFAAFTSLEVGWGDEGFYRAVPTLSALTLPLALRALFRPGNPSVVHVVGLDLAPSAVFAASDLVPIDLSPEGFGRLLTRLDASFARGADGSVAPDLGRGLYGPSLFYRGAETFHVFNVCNHWVARLLDAAGVPTSPILSIVPPGLLLDLRWRAGLRPLGPAKRQAAP